MEQRERVREVCDLLQRRIRVDTQELHLGPHADQRRLVPVAVLAAVARVDPREVVVVGDEQPVTGEHERAGLEDRLRERDVAADAFRFAFGDVQAGEGAQRHGEVRLEMERVDVGDEIVGRQQARAHDRARRRRRQIEEPDPIAFGLVDGGERLDLALLRVRESARRGAELVDGQRARLARGAYLPLRARLLAALDVDEVEQPIV